MHYQNMKKLNQEIMMKFKSWIKDSPIQLLHNITPYKFAKGIDLDINESTEFLNDLHRYGLVSIKINIKCLECGIQNTIYVDEILSNLECIECEYPIAKQYIKNGEIIYVLKDEYNKYFKEEKVQQKQVIDPMSLLLKDIPEIFSETNKIINMEDYGGVMNEQIKEGNKFKIFIGSSKEDISIASSLQEALEYNAEPTIWTQGIFKLSSNALDDLFNIIKDMDAAIFIFTPNDISVIRDEKLSVVRDNLIFELGLTIGILGKKNVFYIIPRGTELHLPTDIVGITPGDYDANRSDNNLVAALNPVVSKIVRQLENNSL